MDWFYQAELYHNGKIFSMLSRGFLGGGRNFFKKFFALPERARGMFTKVQYCGKISQRANKNNNFME